jgi:cysteine desulfurase
MTIPNRPLYFDYMATTPCDPQVVTAMQSCLLAEGDFGNSSSSTHVYGWRAEELIDRARRQVAALVGVSAKAIIWTSGATEADNLAIIGAANQYARKGKHIITMSTEHKAVLDSCAYLSQQGFDVTYLDPMPNGELDLTLLANAIRDDTILISIMHMNNETGVCQDIPRIGQLAREQGVLLHVDAAQSLGKVAIDLSAWQVDLMSFSAHKLFGPKGVGALYVRQQPRVRLQPLIHGGGHELGLRSGTLATHQIVGMGKACELAQQRLTKDTQHVDELATAFWSQLKALPNIEINGDTRNRYPGCFNLYCAGVDAETLIASMPTLALSRGSACNAVTAVPSHVLTSMGRTAEQANQSIRFTLSRLSTLQEVNQAAELLCTHITQLRKNSPLWLGE